MNREHVAGDAAAVFMFFELQKLGTLVQTELKSDKCSLYESFHFQRLCVYYKKTRKANIPESFRVFHLRSKFPLNLLLLKIPKRVTREKSANIDLKKNLRIPGKKARQKSLSSPLMCAELRFRMCTV